VLVGFIDRLRAWLRGDDANQSGAASRSSRPIVGGDGPSGQTRRSSRRRARGQHPAGGGFDGSALLAFARSRNGVEVYLEPRTKLYGDSILLVADDGEYLRRPVPDPETVRRFCSEHGIPVYDAARTGYPRRVRDYDRGVRPRRIGLDDMPPWPGAEPAPRTGPVQPEGHADLEEEPPPPPVD
jgi:hypothetical protein